MGSLGTYRFLDVDDVGELLHEGFLRLVVLVDPAQAAERRDYAGTGHQTGRVVRKPTFCKRKTLL